MGILILCAADALLTLTLISHGASEINPFMDPLVRGSSAEHPKKNRPGSIGLGLHIAKEIVTAWVITIPAAGLIAALCYLAVGLVA